MLERAAQHWWTLTLRGGLAILLALIVFAHPMGAALALVLVFGAYSLVDGILALVAASRLSHQDESWQPLIIEGVIGVLFGLITFADPAAMAVAVTYLVAAWAILTGLLGIVAAVRLRRVIADEWFLIVSGALSVLLGLILLTQPATAFVAVAYILGGYALLFGTLLIALSLRLRHLTGNVTPRA